MPSNEPPRADARRTDAQADAPNPPAGSGTRWRTEGSELILDLPRAGFLMAAYGPIVAVTIFVFVLGTIALLCLALSFGRLKVIDLWARLLVGITFAIACYLVPVMVAVQGILWPAFSRTRVTVSPGFLRVQRRFAGLVRTKEIPAGQLREIVPPTPEDFETFERAMKGERPASVGGSRRPFAIIVPAITARGDKLSIRFAQGLPEAEVRWLHAAIVKGLAK